MYSAKGLTHPRTDLVGASTLARGAAVVVVAVVAAIVAIVAGEVIQRWRRR